MHLTKITGIAGSENHLLMLLGGLRQRGVDARFLLLVEPGNPVDDFVAAAAARDIPAERLRIYHHADLTLYPRLWWRLRALRPDIVHTHLQHADLYGIPAARLARVRAVVTSRHNDDPRRRHPLLRRLNRALWHMVDAGVAISDAIARFSVEVEGAPAARLTTIHYGLERIPERLERAAAREKLCQELGLGGDPLLVGVVARLIPAKGISYGIRAFARQAGRFPGARLLVVGDGPLRTDLEAGAAALGLGRRVRFLGWRADASQIMAALDLLLMPSLREGFGLALLEAMACAVPVVASAVSAIPEVVVHGETGLLCPPRDVEAFSQALGALLSDADLRARMGAAGRARLLAHFQAGHMVEQTLALYQRLCPPHL